MAAGIQLLYLIVSLSYTFLWCVRLCNMHSKIMHLVEIIPLEPDQRSHLRREAPQCRRLLLPLFRGIFVLTNSFVFFSKNLVINRFVFKQIYNKYFTKICFIQAITPYLAPDREFCRQFLCTEFHWRCTVSFTHFNSYSVFRNLHL